MEEGHKMQSTKEKGQKRKDKRTYNDPQITTLHRELMIVKHEPN